MYIYEWSESPRKTHMLMAWAQYLQLRPISMTTGMSSGECEAKSYDEASWTRHLMTFSNQLDTCYFGYQFGCSDVASDQILYMYVDHIENIVISTRCYTNVSTEQCHIRLIQFLFAVIMVNEVS